MNDFDQKIELLELDEKYKEALKELFVLLNDEGKKKLAEKIFS